jgi:hypothetical protein
VRQLNTDNRTLDERLKAARSNLRFQDRRIADLEAPVADPRTVSIPSTPSGRFDAVYTEISAENAEVITTAWSVDDPVDHRATGFRHPSRTEVGRNGCRMNGGPLGK